MMNKAQIALLALACPMLCVAQPTPQTSKNEMPAVAVKHSDNATTQENLSVAKRRKHWKRAMRHYRIPPIKASIDIS